MSNIRLCPVSIGEIFDKLSILELKLKYIKDRRSEDVQKEYNILKNSIEDILIKFKYYYLLIKKVNEDLWHLMDTIRTIDINVNKDEWIFNCKLTIDLNDIRFRIKNKINILCKSDLKEQKSYNQTKIKLYSTNKEHFDLVIKLINYYSINFDIVEIDCNNQVYDLFDKTHLTDSSIIINNCLTTEIYDNIYQLYTKNKLENSDLFNFCDSITFDN